MLTRDASRRFYDRFGDRQDRQAWYEDPAVELLVELAELSAASAVFELGCGTGRVAERLLAEVLPSSATYHAVDLSANMVELARRRLARLGSRVRIEPTGGDPPTDLTAASCDRFLSTYVFDLLPESEIDAWLGEAARLLRPGGRLAIAGLTPGPTRIAHLVSAAWRTVHRLRPSLVGGCRPLAVTPHVLRAGFADVRRRVVVVHGLASEAVVATRPAGSWTAAVRT